MRFPSKALRILLCITPCSAFATGAHFTTATSQAIGRSWNDAIWSPGPVSPTAGNTYEVLSGGLVRNPANSTSTFPGDSLQLDPGSILRMKPPADGVTTTVNFPGVDDAPGLILNGGGIDPGSVQTTFIVAGRLHITADSFLLGPFADSSRNLIFTAALSGNGNVTVQGFFNNAGATVQSASNTYAGNWILSSGRLTGAAEGSLGTGNITVAAGSRIEILYRIVTPGVLTLEATNSLALFTADCQFSGISINGAPVPAGTYTYEKLRQLYPANFIETGSGTVTIAPPATTLQITKNGDTATLNFSTAPVHNYTLQSSATLENPSWTTVGKRIAGDGAIHSLQTTLPGSATFFRVLVE